MERWKELLKEIEKDLDFLEKLVSEEEEMEEMEEIEEIEEMEEMEEMEEKRSIPQRILEDHLHLECYETSTAFKIMNAIKDILEEGDSIEWYNIGVMLIYFSENKGIAYKVEDYLSF